MATTKVVYQGDYRFEATQLASGEKFHSDMPTSAGGKGEYQNPADMLGTAVIYCTMPTMAMAAEKRGLSFEGSYAELGNIEENSKQIIITSIEITFHLRAEYDDATRKRLEHFAHNACYVGNTISAEKKFTFIYDVK